MFEEEKKMPTSPPQELLQELQTIDGIIKSLSDLVDMGKVNTQHYGEEFRKPLTDIRQDGLALRSKLETFKHDLEYALKEQYSEKPGSSRFASGEKVVSLFLSKSSYDL
jgi:hypothetical protein